MRHLPFIEKLLSFACERLALVSLGEITLREAVWLIDANADGMFEVLETQGQWQAIERLEECRADLRKGVEALFGELPKDADTVRQVVIDAAARIRPEVANVASLFHRQNREGIREVLGS